MAQKIALTIHATPDAARYLSSVLMVGNEPAPEDATHFEFVDLLARELDAAADIDVPEFHGFVTSDATSGVDAVPAAT